MMRSHIPWFLFAVLLLSGCAGRALTPEQTALRAVTPMRVVEQPAAHEGRVVEWGGILIATHNRADHTLLEILAYPLNSEGRPLRDRAPLGRFLARHDGYLEAMEYAPGRLVTASGPLAGIRRGRVGDREYVYPLVQTRQLRLWPRHTLGTEPRIHFGIGVGSGGVGWGAGVGF